MTDLGTVFVDVKANWAKFAAESSAMGAATTSSFGRYGLLAGAALVGAATAAVAVGGAGVVAAAGFDKQMREVFTLLPGITQPAMNAMSDQVKKFSQDFGVLPDKIVPALYQSLSAGIPADNVFAFLETAQKAARGGVTELETAVDGISSVVNAYGKDVISAGQASDFMFTAVKVGKTTFEELSQNLANVTPLASGLGISFGDVTASISTMTAQGTKTAVATTQLRQLFTELSDAGGETGKTFEKLAGKSFAKFIADGGNVQQALQLMEQAAGKNGVSIKDMFGSVEAGSAALQLTGKGAETFAANLEAMGGSAGATDAAFKTMDEGVSASWDRIKSNVMVALLEIGEGLLPVVEPISKWLAETLPTAVAQIQPIFDGIGNGISSISEVFGKAGGASGGATNGFAGLLAVVNPLAATAVLVRENWEKLSDFFGRFSASIQTWFAENSAKVEGWRAKLAEIGEQVSPILEKIGFIINNVVSTAIDLASWAWDQFGETIMNVVGAAIGPLLDILGSVMTVLDNLLGFIINIFSGNWSEAWQNVKNIFGAVWDAIFAFFESIIGQIRAVVEGLGPKLWNLFTTIMSGVWNIIVSAWEGIMGFFTSLPGRILSALGSLAGLLISKGWELIEGMARGIRDNWGSVIGFLLGVPGAVLGAIGDAASWLVDAGGNVISGLLNGMKGGAKAVYDWITGLLNGVKDKVLGFFGINSPSRMFMDIGANLMLGLREGLAAERDGVFADFAGINADISGSISPGDLASNARPALTPTVNAQTSADPYQIAAEIDWLMKTAGRY